ncbi:IRSp53/MIM homology domain-containing protein [Ditylenchus destructor]|nr:IRSp53/MIM homology domain-containing protein [Ditylenchus destructor]
MGTSSTNNVDTVLSSLFQVMVHDLKASSTAWENVCSKASKLSAQLNSVVASLSNFIDAVQVISDHANNVKGCSRDIGAALTRFCLRQKSLENLIRSLANALSDQFVVSVEKKAAEWKFRVSEIERQRSRALKKSKQQKKYGDGTEKTTDNKNRYVEVLNEQRSQFVYFVNALLPILNIEVNLLDEGSHVRQMRDALENTANNCDSQPIIEALLEDLCINADDNSPTNKLSSPTATWHRMLSASRCTGLNTPMTDDMSIDQHYGALKNSYHEQNSLSPTSSTLSTVWPEGSMAGSLTQADYCSPQNSYRKVPLQQMSNSLASSTHSHVVSTSIARPHTISSSADMRRPPISANTFVHPAPSSPNSGESGANCAYYGMTQSPAQSPNSCKPPLPRRQLSTGSSIGGNNQGLYSVPSSQRITASPYSSTMTISSGHPLSISANDLSSPTANISFSMQPNNGTVVLRRQTTGNPPNRPVSLSGCSELEEVNNRGRPGGCSTSLIAETLQQIDQLGVELDSYSTMGDNTSSGVGSSNASLDTLQGQKQTQNEHYSNFTIQNPSNGSHQRHFQNMGQNTLPRMPPTSLPIFSGQNSTIGPTMGRTAGDASGVRYRQVGNVRPPPPLPQRRNSTITSATPTNPSVADLRTSAGTYSPFYHPQPPTPAPVSGPNGVMPGPINQNREAMNNSGMKLANVMPPPTRNKQFSSQQRHQQAYQQQFPQQQGYPRV